jgi:YHS domain-containing protein
MLWLEDGEFKEIVTMAEDPVCRMAIEREKAADRTEYSGVTYFFCSRGCRAEFEADATRFLLPELPAR